MTEKLSQAEHRNEFDHISSINNKIDGEQKFVQTDEYTYLNSWMSNLCVKNSRFWDICFPGTHNSASWKFADDSDKKWGAVVFNFVKQYVLCQDLNIYAQLYLGARFLDLRVCRHLKKGGEPYCAHGGFRTVPLVLEEVANFVAKFPSEIILLSIRKDAAFMNGKESIETIESDFYVLKYLHNFVGQRLTANITIGELAEKGQNIIYFFEERERFLSRRRFSDVTWTQEKVLKYKKPRKIKVKSLKQSYSSFTNASSVNSDEQYLNTSWGSSSVCDDTMLCGGAVSVASEQSLQAAAASISIYSERDSTKQRFRVIEQTLKQLENLNRHHRLKVLKLRKSPNCQDWCKSGDTKVDINAEFLVTPTNLLNTLRDVEDDKIHSIEQINKNEQMQQCPDSLISKMRSIKHKSFSLKTRRQLRRRRASLSVRKNETPLLSGHVTRAILKRHQNSVSAMSCSYSLNGALIPHAMKRSDTLPFEPAYKVGRRRVEREILLRHQFSVSDQVLKIPPHASFSVLEKGRTKSVSLDCLENDSNETHIFSGGDHDVSMRAKEADIASDRSDVVAFDAANAVKRLLSRGKESRPAELHNNPRSKDDFPSPKMFTRTKLLFFDRDTYSDPEFQQCRFPGKSSELTIARESFTDTEINQEHNTRDKLKKVPFSSSTSVQGSNNTEKTVDSAKFDDCRISLVLKDKKPQVMNGAFARDSDDMRGRLNNAAPSICRESLVRTNEKVSGHCISFPHNFQHAEQTAKNLTVCEQQIKEVAEILNQGSTLRDREKSDDMISFRKSNFSTPFAAGETHIVKSWSVTNDSNPQMLCNKLQYWSMTYGAMRPRKPFILRILAGEITAPSLRAQKASASVLKYWTSQGASALFQRKAGLQAAAVETHRYLLKHVIKSHFLDLVNGLTHDFLDGKLVEKVVMLNISGSNVTDSQ